MCLPGCTDEGAAAVGERVGCWQGCWPRDADRIEGRKQWASNAGVKQKEEQ